MTELCRACGNSQSLELLLDLGPIPLAGAFLDGPHAASTGTLPAADTRMQCLRAGPDCAAIDPAILFQDYSFAAAQSRGSSRTLTAMRAGY